MSVSAVLNTCTLIATTRIAAETSLTRHVRNLETPSRLASLLHGVLCSVSLMEGNWADAVQSTGLFFAMDTVLTLGFRRRLPWDTALHHTLGMILCLFSTLTRSFEHPQLGADLTRALILFETSNPLLHLLVTLRKEGIQDRVPRIALQFIQTIFLLQFAGIRLGLLAHALWHVAWVLDKANDFELGMFWSSLAMWLLQWIWFIKLVGARTK